MTMPLSSPLAESAEPRKKSYVTFFWVKQVTIIKLKKKNWINDTMNLPSFHLKESQSGKSAQAWTYLFDHKGRRHCLELTEFEFASGAQDFLVRHRLVRKDYPLGPIETTPLFNKVLSRPPIEFCNFTRLLEDPLWMGEPVAQFFEENFRHILEHVEATAHEKIELTSTFLQALSEARRNRKATAARRCQRLKQAREEGFVLREDCKDGVLVRLCPKYHSDLPADDLATTFVIRRKSPRSLFHRLVAVDGPNKGENFFPPGFVRVYRSVAREA